jgi:glyoxylase-like metal-dependent hydrolase (beta-lactamase superfamily II)
MIRLLTSIVLLFSSAVAHSHDVPKAPAPMPLDELMQAFGWDPAGTQIRVQTLNANLHVLFGVGGNIAVSIGDDGVLVVDDQFPAMMPKIKAAINSLGGEKVDFAINTHWHFDHADGNQALGPAGTWIVSQANSRQMMLGDHVVNLVLAAYEQKAYPADALPTMTFDDTMQFHLNGEQIELVHFGPAHTTGDAAVIFRTSNAVHLGDVFNNSGYPFIDADNGGSLDGVIKFCSDTLAMIDPETIVIPGHGPVTDYQTLSDYIDMLTTVRLRMVTLIDNGASLEDVFAADVSREWDARNGDNQRFINRAYVSLIENSHDE